MAWKYGIAMLTSRDLLTMSLIKIIHSSKVTLHTHFFHKIRLLQPIHNYIEIRLLQPCAWECYSICVLLKLKRGSAIMSFALRLHAFMQ